jgi:hypothetical protein
MSVSPGDQGTEGGNSLVLLTSIARKERSAPLPTISPGGECLVSGARFSSCLVARTESFIRQDVSSCYPRSGQSSQATPRKEYISADAPLRLAFFPLLRLFLLSPPGQIYESIYDMLYFQKLFEPSSGLLLQNDLHHAFDRCEWSLCCGDVSSALRCHCRTCSNPRTHVGVWHFLTRTARSTSTSL